MNQCKACALCLMIKKPSQEEALMEFNLLSCLLSQFFSSYFFLTFNMDKLKKMHCHVIFHIIKLPLRKVSLSAQVLRPATILLLIILLWIHTWARSSFTSMVLFFTTLLRRKQINFPALEITKSLLRKLAANGLFCCGCFSYT